MSSVTLKINVFILVRITRGIVHVVVFTIDYCHMFVFILVRITRGIVHVVVFTITISFKSFDAQTLSSKLIPQCCVFIENKYFMLV